MIPELIRHRPLLGLVAATLLVRIAALMLLGAHFDQDPDAYANLAQGVRQHGVLGFVNPGSPVRPTALRPPIYPLLLAPLVVDGGLSAFGVAVLHLLLGAATVIVVERLGALWQLGVWRWLAAGLVACDPLLLNQSTLVMSETLATLLAAVCLLALTSLNSGSFVSSGLDLNSDRSSWQAGLARAGLAGVLLAVAILSRPTFAPWAALAAACCWQLPGSIGRRLSLAATLLLAVALVLGCWAGRNQRSLGHPIVATTHGGYTLLLGNNPHFFEHLRGSSHARPWDARELLEGYRAEGHRQATFRPDVPLEIQRDRLDYRLAADAIGREPGMFVRASLARIGRLWSPLPSQSDSNESTARRAVRYLTGTWYVVVLGLAAVGLVSLGWATFRLPWLWGLSLCAVFTVMHAFYWSDLRMRAPLVPVICLLAACGACWLVTRSHQRR